MPETDVLAPVEARLTSVEKGVNALLTAMNLVIDTLHQQTNLLGELAVAARETPADSPVVGALETLTEAVVTMGSGIEALRTEMGGLPDRLRTVLTGEEAALAQGPGLPPGS